MHTGGEAVEIQRTAKKLTLRERVLPWSSATPPPLSPSYLEKDRQSRTIPSSAPDASMVPSGENATEWTQSVCPVRMSNRFRLATSHRITVLSSVGRRERVCPGCQHGSVGRKRHGVDIPRMPFEGGLPPPPRDIPQDYGVIA